MSVHEFTCEMCHRTLQSDQPEEDAELEYAQMFPESAKREVERGIVCHDCWVDMIEQMPPEQAEKDFYENM